jgi:hypothetical protein
MKNIRYLFLISILTLITVYDVWGSEKLLNEAKQLAMSQRPDRYYTYTWEKEKGSFVYLIIYDEIAKTITLGRAYTGLAPGREPVGFLISYDEEKKCYYFYTVYVTGKRGGKITDDVAEVFVKRKIKEFFLELKSQGFIK